MEPAGGGFSEDQFREACAELRRPALPGASWELLLEALGISIYGLLDQLLQLQTSIFKLPRRPAKFTVYIATEVLLARKKQTGLYEYKVFGVLDNCLPDVLADVYMDLDYRKQWDQYVKELYEKECNGETVVYWQVKYPFPMSNRDYIYIRQRRDLDLDGRKIHVILAQSTSVPQIAERSGVVRVNQYKQSLAIESDGKKGSKVFMYYFDNPGGQIPSWLINWVAKSGVPNFLKDMGKACQNYLKKT
uniref:Phosphatidylcholine transfer protein n=2 Tax=Canidae TaxID=9608 RepID=A0A8C0TYP7_CANLF